MGLCWVAMSLLGCLPFYLSGQIPRYVDALFEVVSGFTTTGASILADPGQMSRGLLFWRSSTHWLGGMGILVFALAIVPAGRKSGAFYLMRAESPGPSVGKFTPRLRQTSKILYAMYVALTALCVLFLLGGGMPLFESLCTAFGTAGTGGFGVKADSMASYTPYLQWVVTIFMALFGVNFSIYYLLLLRRFRLAAKDEELHCYVLVLLAAGGLIAWNIRPMMASWGESVRHAFFQVSSIMTTTGFSTVNFDLWPAFSKAILLCLMLIGACAGSTGGGVKGHPAGHHGQGAALQHPAHPAPPQRAAGACERQGGGGRGPAGRIGVSCGLLVHRVCQLHLHFAGRLPAGKQLLGGVRLHQ